MKPGRFETTVLTLFLLAGVYQPFFHHSSASPAWRLRTDAHSKRSITRPEKPPISVLISFVPNCHRSEKDFVYRFIDASVCRAAR
jgi:hypothetical protein